MGALEAEKKRNLLVVVDTLNHANHKEEVPLACGSQTVCGSG